MRNVILVGFCAIFYLTFAPTVKADFKLSPTINSGYKFKGSKRIKRNEIAYLLPGYAVMSAGGTKWIVYIEGISLAKRRFVSSQHAEKKFIQTQYKVGKPIRNQTFERRLRLFIQKQYRRKRIRVKIFKHSKTLYVYRAGDNYTGIFRIKTKKVKRDKLDRADSASYQASTKLGDSRLIKNRIFFIPHNGLSVITVVDDTLLQYEPRSGEAQTNQLLSEPYQALMRTVAALRSWSNENSKIRFHYITSRPIHLYPSLSRYFDLQKIPLGIWHMRSYYSKKPARLDTLMLANKEYLSNTIKTLLTRFPHRKFVLIGSTSTNDYTVFSELCKKYPNRFTAVYLNDRRDLLNKMKLKNDFPLTPVIRYSTERKTGELALRTTNTYLQSISHGEKPYMTRKQRRQLKKENRRKRRAERKRLRRERRMQK